MTMIYHLVRAGTADAACVLAGTGTVTTGDQLVPEAEANDPAGRHFNCPACFDVVSGGQRHVPPPAGWEENPDG